MRLGFGLWDLAVWGIWGCSTRARAEWAHELGAISFGVRQIDDVLVFSVR
jgi:hypothetical protein